MQDGQRAGQYSTLQKRFGTRKKQKNNLAETARQDRFAQSTDVYAVKASNYKGLRRGSPVYLPNDWYVYNLSEEQTQQGVLFAAGDTSGIENPPGISVVWAYSDGVQSLEELAADLTQGGYQVDDLVSINGIPCVSYRVEENDCSAIMFFHPTNKQYLFCVTGTGYASNTDMICHILTSLSLT